MRTRRRTVLVVAAHPDDEAIGCGGAIRLHDLAGDRVHTIFLTSGEHGDDGNIVEVMERREREAGVASQVLNTKGVEFWRLPDGALEATTEACERMVDAIRALDPGIVYIPNRHDSHPDHRAAAEIVDYATVVFTPPAEIRQYEVWTPLAEWDVALDVSGVIWQKLAAIRAHGSQVARMRFDDAALSLARYRGEMHNRPHGPYAEVFKKLCP